MTDAPESFMPRNWDEYTTVTFLNHAEDALSLELRRIPDMTPREREYFFDKSYAEAKFARLYKDTEAYAKLAKKLTDEIKILNAKLDHMGTLTKERGAWFWQKLQTLERRYGVATLEQVDIVKSLMTEAPLEIRVKPNAKNVYKLANDLSNWVIKFAEEAGRKVKREVSTIKKLRCLRFYADETVPPRPEKRRRVHGEPRQKQAWAVMNENTRFFREYRKDSYDPGG